MKTWSLAVFLALLAHVAACPRYSATTLFLMVIDKMQLLSHCWCLPRERKRERDNTSPSAYLEGACRETEEKWKWSDLDPAAGPSPLTLA
jgi:hypothetical protein